jgi:hypothetical protein|tara:strand:- start:119 stop:502 length:384 start_codon:yes stop_codon:yes gene_type:complete
MAILGNILGNLLGKADKIVDEVITSQEEKMQLKNELQKIIQEQEALIEQEVTKRWESDNNQSSWLPRNIRPLVLAWLVVSTTLLIFIDAGVIDFIVADKWVDLLQIVLITCIGAYFGSRGLEKIKTK